VEKIFKTSCAGCHKANHPTKLDLTLTGAALHTELLESAMGAMCTASGDKRVVPGMSAMSLLYKKVTNAAGVCGAPMPKAATFKSLSDADLATIKSWIDGGAKM
jgi:mono/diheme cytochrome c family protein